LLLLPIRDIPLSHFLYSHSILLLIPLEKQLLLLLLTMLMSHLLNLTD
jgi:hypothetical protein